MEECFMMNEIAVKKKNNPPTKAGEARAGGDGFDIQKIGVTGFEPATPSSQN
jgi:hypothetical protein